MDGFFSVFPFIHDAGVHDVQEIQGGLDFLHGFVFAFSVGAPMGTVQILEPGGCDKKQSRLGFALFIGCFHIVLYDRGCNV